MWTSVRHHVSNSRHHVSNSLAPPEQQLCTMWATVGNHVSDSWSPCERQLGTMWETVGHHVNINCPSYGLPKLACCRVVLQDRAAESCCRAVLQSRAAGPYCRTVLPSAAKALAWRCPRWAYLAFAPAFNACIACDRTTPAVPSRPSIKLSPAHLYSELLF